MSATSRGTGDGREVWLGVDTATDRASVALCDGAEVMAERSWTGRRQQTRQLAPTVAGMLRDAELRPSELAGVAVTIGPGSYTGLRIGLSLAKGLVLGGAGCLVGVPTLHVLAASSQAWGWPEAAGWAVLRAGRGRVVAARYPTALPEEGGWPATWPDPAQLAVGRIDELCARVAKGEHVAGELDAAARAALAHAGARVAPPAACLRRAAWLVALGRRRVEAGDEDNAATLEPVYPGGSP